jgi:hypothetical protein
MTIPADSSVTMVRILSQMLMVERTRARTKIQGNYVHSIRIGSSRLLLNPGYWLDLNSEYSKNIE